MMYLKRLLEELNSNKRNCLYSICQINLAKESSNIEGYSITTKETKDIFETRDLFEAIDEMDRTKKQELLSGHFFAFNSLLKTIDEPLNIDIIKTIHKSLMEYNFEFIAKGGKAGEFKHKPNIVGMTETTKPENIEKELTRLIESYPINSNLQDICDFHFDFEHIHPFQDGNGRVGRLIMFRECLKHLDKICIIPEDFNLQYKQSFSKGKQYLFDVVENSITYTLENILSEI